MSVWRINWNSISSKPGNIFWSFSSFSGIYIKFWTFWKKWRASYLIYFRNYRLQKAWLLKCLKSPASEHLWRVNMLKYPKHCWNLHCSSFAIFFLSIWKSFSSKSSVLIVSEILRLFDNRWTLSDKNSLSLKVSVYRNQFKSSYVENRESFLNFMLNFWNLHQIFDILKIKDERHSWRISKI